LLSNANAFKGPLMGGGRSMGWQLMQVVLQYACWKLDLSNMDSSLIVCGFVGHHLDCLNGWMWGWLQGLANHTMVIDCWSMAFSEIQVNVGPNIVVVFAIQNIILWLVSWWWLFPCKSRKDLPKVEIVLSLNNYKALKSLVLSLHASIETQLH
jgi:hypothetical protein